MNKDLITTEFTCIRFGGIITFGNGYRAVFGDFDDHLGHKCLDISVFVTDNRHLDINQGDCFKVNIESNKYGDVVYMV